MARAMRQGELDGLCGVYAIINAARYLLPQLHARECEKLLRKLVSCLEKRLRRPLRAVADGIRFGVLRKPAKRAARFVKRRFGVKLKARSLTARRKHRTVEGICSALAEKTKQGCVAIIGIAGAEEHWCVVYKVTGRSLAVLDSSGRTYLRRTRCTMSRTKDRYRLHPSEVLLLSIAKTAKIKPR
jgi:hypothetical protein